MRITWFGRDPAVWIQAIAAVIAVLVTLNLDWLTVDQAAAIVGFLTVGAGLLAALATQPFSVQAATTFITGAAVLAAAYGFKVPPETLGAVQLMVAPVLTLLLRGAITPNHDPRPLPGEVIDGEIVETH